MKKASSIIVLGAGILALLAGCCGTSDTRFSDLESRVAKLEQTVKASTAKQDAAKLVLQQKIKARARMADDSKIYSDAELDVIENLYQVANSKWGTPEAVESLKTMTSKYKKSNRTGCAILYLGQMSTGDEQVANLKRSIDEYGDCFYGDGVQVGAYARFVLANVYLQKGEKEKSEKLIKEIKTLFPDSVGHDGNSLVVAANELGKN